MQPSHDQPNAPYGSNRTEDPFGTWAHPTYEQPQGPMVTRGRPWIVALAAFLTLLVLIAALGNQWVTDSIRRHANGDTFIDHIVTAITTYQWRFTPRGGHDVARVWVSDFALVGTALVLTLVLVGTVCRGKGGFAQAFFGSWMTVLVATLIGGYVKAAVVDRSLLLRSITRDTGNAIFFSPLSPGTSDIVAGIEFGFVVALVAGAAAVLSRRREPIAGAAATPPASAGAPAAPYAAPGQMPERPYAEPQPAPTPVPAGSPWSYQGEPAAAESEPEHTAVLPPVDQPRSQDGTERGAEADATGGGARSARDTASDTEHTTQLPRTEGETAPERDGSDTAPDREHPTPDTAPDTEHTTQLPRTEGDTAPERDEPGPRPQGG